MSEVILHLTSGKGPDECCWVVARLAEAFVKEGKTLGVACEVLDGDDVPNALLRRADGVNARILVMATRVPQAIDRAILGRVADRVGRDGTRPVVLVPMSNKS